MLLEAAEKNGFDALFGGGRRDEEKARAKERVFSFRDEFGQWDPKNQRPEIWNLYNGRVFPGQSIRVFPLSNWTELDIWTYIAEEAIEIPDLYLAADREVVERGRDAVRGQPVHPAPRRRDAAGAAGPLPDGRRREPDRGGGVGRRHASRRSWPRSPPSAITERGATRGDDKVSEAAMEDRKKEGYF